MDTDAAANTVTATDRAPQRGDRRIVGSVRLLRVMFHLEPDAWHAYATERLWAEEVGSNRYRLRNSPFYAHGVSFEDVVFAEADRDGELVFRGVSLRGGHSTYRVMLCTGAEDPAFREHWAPLQALGCSFEGANKKLLSVDVPGTADINKAYALLEAGEEAGVWSFEEGHCGHPVGDSTAETP